MAESVAYVCPHCKSALKDTQEAYSCQACNRTYYIVNGIPRFIAQEDFQDAIPLVKSGTFNKISKLYDTNFVYNIVYQVLCGRKVPPLATLKQKIVDLCNPQGKILLDIACGSGKFSRVIASSACKVYGIDISQGMLEQAKEKAKEEHLENIFLSQGNAEALPFNDHSFDAACCTGALHYFPDTVKSLREIARVLKPGSPFVIMTLIRRRIFRYKTVYEHMQRSHGAHIFLEDELLKWLDEAGFKDVISETYGSMIVLQAKKK